VFILPSRSGLGLGLLLVIQLLAATNYNNNLAFILSFLLASLALLNIFYTFRNLVGLSVRPGKAEPVFAGETAQFEIHLDNPQRGERTAIGVSTQQTTTIWVDIPAQGSFCVRLPIVTRRRGWRELPTLTLASVFPLGWFRAWSPINLQLKVLVYPTPSETNLPLPEQLGSGAGLQFHADDFQGFRPYQPGDPPRHIHWKGLAKGQTLQVKQFRGGRQADLILDWLDTPGEDGEARLSQLCRWVLDAERADLSFGLRLPGLEIPVDRGYGHGLRCLEALALFSL
jgi:uncharacterized protein (DUF58 family)